MVLCARAFNPIMCNLQKLGLWLNPLQFPRATAFNPLLRSRHWPAVVRIPIADGGGVMSTACWVIPQEPVDRLKELRSLFLSWMRDWGIIPRLRSLVQEGKDQCLFSTREQQLLQKALVEFLQARSFPCSPPSPTILA